jgi:hypothetical protein
MRVQFVAFEAGSLFADVKVQGQKIRAEFQLTRTFRVIEISPGSLVSVFFDHRGRVANLEEAQGEVSNLQDLILVKAQGLRRRVVILSGIPDKGERVYFAIFCKFRRNTGKGTGKVVGLVEECGVICDIRTETPTPTPTATPRVQPRTTEG